MLSTCPMFVAFPFVLAMWSACSEGGLQKGTDPPHTLGTSTCSPDPADTVKLQWAFTWLFKAKCILFLSALKRTEMPMSRLWSNYKPCIWAGRNKAYLYTVLPLLPGFCLTSVICGCYMQRQKSSTFVFREHFQDYQQCLVKACCLSHKTECYFQGGPMDFFRKLQKESRALLRAQLQASVSILEMHTRAGGKKTINFQENQQYLHLWGTNFEVSERRVADDSIKPMNGSVQGTS